VQHAAKVSDLKSPVGRETLHYELKEGAGQPAAGVPHKLQLLLQVFRVWQVWYLACCNILKGKHAACGLQVGSLAVLYSCCSSYSI
jgi:hypothetical protein